MKLTHKRQINENQSLSDFYSSHIAAVYLASRQIFKRKSYKLLFLLLTAIFIAAYILLPVWLTPGNTLSFQLSLLRASDYLLFIFLSAVTALFVLMQIFLFTNSKKGRAKVIGQGGVGTFSALFGGLLATAACSSCIAAILGFLGAGSIFFVLENQPYFVYGAVALVLLGLYFSAQQVQGYCKDCNVKTSASKDSKNQS